MYRCVPLCFQSLPLQPRRGQRIRFGHLFLETQHTRGIGIDGAAAAVAGALSFHALQRGFRLEFAPASLVPETTSWQALQVGGNWPHYLGIETDAHAQTGVYIRYTGIETDIPHLHHLMPAYVVNVVAVSNTPGNMQEAQFWEEIRAALRSVMRTRGPGAVHLPQARIAAGFWESDGTMVMFW